MCVAECVARCGEVCVVVCVAPCVAGCVAGCVTGCVTVFATVCVTVCVAVRVAASVAACGAVCAVGCVARWCSRVLPCVAAERGRDHHHDDLTLKQRAAVRCSVVLRVAVCRLQPLHHVPCAVAADTRPPASRCLPSHAYVCE